MVPTLSLIEMEEVGGMSVMDNLRAFAMQKMFPQARTQIYSIHIPNTVLYSSFIHVRLLCESSHLLAISLRYLTNHCPQIDLHQGVNACFLGSNSEESTSPNCCVPHA